MKAAGISQKSIGALTPHDGATYWRFLAEQLVNSVSDETYPHQLLGVINKWLSDKFDSGYVIDNDIELELDPLSFDKLDAQSKVMDHPYWLNVKLSLKDTQTKNRTYPHAVGVGISQLIPVLIAMIVEQRLYIEQPELHLHPKLQLVVSDIAVSRLNKMREEKNCWLLAETHSEHMILRLLRRVAETNSDIKHRDYWLSKDEVTVYYVKNDGGGAVFHKLRITDDGDFEDDWPDGFFEDRDSELFY
jgi:ABC-type dipeptide/oligopeptide/nickel transport system ATPase component